MPSRRGDLLVVWPGKSLGRVWVKYAFPVVVVMLVLGGLLAVMLSSKDSGAYDLSLSELLEEPSKYIGRDVRVNGTIEKNSYRERKSEGDKIDIEFAINNVDGQRILVRYHQILPDAFEEGREVIVAGKLSDPSTIDCNRLTVKCPSKYKDEKTADAQKWDEYRSTFQAGDRLETQEPKGTP